MGKAALAAIALPENLIAWGPDPEGKASYPIVTYTWVICYKNNKDAKKGEIASRRADLVRDRRSEGKRREGIHSPTG